MVLRLLMEQIPGKQSLKADSLKFKFLFCCVSLGKLPKLSGFQFPIGFIFRICLLRPVSRSPALSFLWVTSISSPIVLCAWCY